MANEISVTAAISVNKAGVTLGPIAFQVLNQLLTMAGSAYESNVLPVTTSALAVPLGNVTQPHWTFMVNLDGANYIRIRNGSGGADVLRLHPGEPAVFPMYYTASPYAISEAGTPLLQYLLIQL